MQTKPIGILGGAFDPVHFGHLRTALEMKQILDLETMRFVPCHKPVHKENTVADAQHRLNMLHLAIEYEPDFIIDDREIKRTTPSYMIETLQSLRQEFKTTPLTLIIGSDAFTNLASWRNWQQLLDYAHIAIAIRAGQKMQLDTEMTRFLNTHQTLDWGVLHESLNGKIFLQSVTPLDISSSTIRCQLAAKYNSRFLLPNAVLDYIHTNQLYL